MDLKKTLQQWWQRVAPAPRLDRSDRDGTIAQLESARLGDRWRAAERLGAGDPGRAGVAALTTALRDADPILRWEAAQALARTGVAAGHQALLDALASDDPALQAVAADGLGRLSTVPPPPAVVTALAAALQSPSPAVRQSAAEALAQLAARPVSAKASAPTWEIAPVSALVEVVQSEPAPLVRRAAALALGHLGAPEARPVLEACQADPREEPLVREAAAVALTRLRPPESPGDEVSPVDAGEPLPETDE